MKRILLSAILVGFSAMASAQVGAVAPNFTQTDINGVDHDLYAYLNSGRTVIVDMSATWCPPCWSFHETHYLEDLHQEFGPNGTNQAVVIFYEDDVSTTLADLQGTGSNTQGDWTDGVTYPIINATQVLPSQYGSGYPTVSVICASDKKIQYIIPTGASYQTIRQGVLDVINQCSGPASVNEQASALELTVAPNPTSDFAQVTFSSQDAGTATVTIYDVTGKVLSSSERSIQSGTNNLELNFEAFETGSYYVSVSTENAASSMIRIAKQ